MPADNRFADRPSPLRGAVEAGAAYRCALERGEAIPLVTLTAQALQLRKDNHYALHPVETALRHHGDSAEAHGAQSHGRYDFESAESHYRAGAQGLRLSEIPQLPEQLRELSRLASVDRAGRKALLRWAETHGPIFDDCFFQSRWESQGQRGGAEHHVYHDQDQGRWFKRLYHGVNLSTLGDYLVRMRLHAVLFPETAYRLEGFTIQAKSKTLAPVVSQPHVEIDVTRPPVSKTETEALMADMGFAPVQLIYDGIRDDGYFAYVHPETGVLAHDLHDENVVRVAGTGEIAVIDPYIALSRRGGWAAIKLAEIGLPPPLDDASP